MQTLFHFWKPSMETHKRELSIVRDYYDRTKVQFDDLEKETDEYANSIFQTYPATEYTDPASIAEWATDQGMERYETLSILKKNHLLMTILMLYQIWEQQLIRFTWQELRNILRFDRKSLSYAKAQRVFELHGVDICNTKSWGKIRELKLLVNTIKHGDGDSAEKLRKIRPDIFEFDLIGETETVELEGTVLLNPYALQVEESDLLEYVEAAKAFWDEMPERAYADADVIIEALAGKQKK